MGYGNLSNSFYKMTISHAFLGYSKGKICSILEEDFGKTCSKTAVVVYKLVTNNTAA
jgi:hypothetical protein